MNPFTTWITDFEWTTVPHETFRSLREIESARRYREAWERFTKKPWDDPSNPHFHGLLLGSK